MRKHFWFVIEGDNGAGKDSLADRLINDKWCSASRHCQALDQKKLANGLTGIDRINAFLSYNQMCGKLASGHKCRCFLVRYWPSTLAGGFADCIINWKEFITRVDQCITQFPATALILYLQCGLDIRRNRVRQRGLVSGSVDDVSKQRDVRYQEAIRWLAQFPRLGNWKTLDTSKLTIEEVHQAVQALLAKVEASS